MKTSLKIVLALSGFSVLLSCNDTENPFAYQKDTHSRGNIEIFVEESFKPLFTTSIYTFESQFPSAHLKSNYCTEQEAIAAFLAKKTKTIFITRDFTKKEKEKLKLTQVEVRSEKIAEDAVALIVHPDNPDTSLSVNRLKNILKGKDLNWKSLNTKIDVVFDNQNSANFVYLKQLIGDASISANVFAVKSNEEVINYVKNHPNALGVIGVNWISDEDDSAVLDFLDGIKVVEVSKDNSTEYFKPYQAYIYTKEYPLTRELWSINKGGRSGLNSGFVNFLVGEKGQLIIQKSCLVPSNSPIRMMQIKVE
jgi:phosphate transport system substrate-binding protein